MKNLKKKLSARGGFTLVELIVVIAILAILAGVGTAAYSGYIKKAQDASVLETLDALKTAVVATATVEGKTVTKIEVSPNGSVVKYYTGDSDSSGTDVTSIQDYMDYFSNTNTVDLTKSETYKNGAQWTSAGWVSATVSNTTTNGSEGGGEGA